MGIFATITSHSKLKILRVPLPHVELTMYISKLVFLTYNGVSIASSSPRNANVEMGLPSDVQSESRPVLPNMIANSYTTPPFSPYLWVKSF